MKQVKELCLHKQTDLYEKAFNFFQSKSINLILSNRKNDHAILFRDLEFMDDDVEYLKRFYQTNESLIRIHKLISYYEVHMTPPIPNLMPLENYHIMDARHRKILKLEIMREKSQARRREQRQNENSAEIFGQKNTATLISEEHILPQLEDPNFSQIQSNKEDTSYESYDSSVHDIFQDHHQNKADSLSRNGHSILLQDQTEMKGVFCLKDIKQSELIIDFKKVIGIKKNQEQLREPRKSRDSNQNNSDKLPFAPPQKIPHIKEPPSISLSVATSSYRPKFASSDHFQFSKSPMHRAHESGLTESHQNQQQQKKGSFMEYYNSISKTNSSNLLEKYIKSKR